MGFACPVCGDPQADAPHLANHLAFTAMVRGGDHEAWLDEHVPDWEELGEDALGDRLVERAEDAEYPQVFEDTTDGADGRGHDDGEGHGHQHGHDHGHGSGSAGTTDPLVENARSRAADGDFSADASDVLEEARELTRQRHENATANGGDDEDASDSETE